MASQSSSVKGRSVAAMAMILVVLTSSLAVAEGMAMNFENDMTVAVSVDCNSNISGDLGTGTLAPGQRYTAFTVPGTYYSGLRYKCTFSAAGKPFTTIAVFIGWGGMFDSPCNCRGDTCAWTITTTKISCNGGTFSQAW